MCVYIFPPASSRFGQSLSRHRHSPLGTGHLCHLRQTARGKLGAHAAQLHSKVHRLLFSAVRKQLLPLAQVFTQTQTVGGCHLVRMRKAKFRTGLGSLENRYIITIIKPSKSGFEIRLKHGNDWST